MTSPELTCWVRGFLFAVVATAPVSAADENVVPSGQTGPRESVTAAAQPPQAIALASNPVDAHQGGPVADEELFTENREAKQTANSDRPVSSAPLQIFGWLEKVKIADIPDEMAAKLDTGALTSSLHAEEEKLFERDGQKWVRFVITEPGVVGGKRHVMEALLARTAEIKEPGGLTERRSVVRLNFLIGERSVRAEFTLNDRKNMLCPVLLGRSALRILGWVDPARTFLADDKIFR